MASSRTRSAIRCDLEQAQNQIAALVSEPLDPERSYTTQVHTLLRDSIVRGQLPPGTPLSESAVSAAMGVSRTPVREALRYLVKEQLVEVYPQVGTRVTPLNEALIREGCFVRRGLECANLMDVVETITDDQRIEIRALGLKLKDALSKGALDLVFKLDDEMHGRLFEFAGRPRVWTLISSTKLHLDRIRWLLLDRMPGHGERILDEHNAIVEHLLAGDAEALCTQMKTHIEAVAVHLIELRKCTPDSYFSD